MLTEEHIRDVAQAEILHRQILRDGRPRNYKKIRNSCLRGRKISPDQKQVWLKNYTYSSDE
jgi:hypothetical protein